MREAPTVIACLDVHHCSVVGRKRSESLRHALDLVAGIGRRLAGAGVSVSSAA